MLTLKQAAAEIGLSTSTLNVQIRRGVIKARKIGPAYVITRGELRRYEDERKGKSGFANPNHPLYGKRGGGGPPKKDEG